jgi:hypothetical protein
MLRCHALRPHVSYLLLLYPSVFPIVSKVEVTTDVHEPGYFMVADLVSLLK